MQAYDLAKNHSLQIQLAYQDSKGCVMYSNYDDRYGCRVSEEDNDARSALQKAEAALEWRRADLMQLKHAISMFDEHGWDTPNDFVYSESGVLLRTINGCEPFFACHTWKNRAAALELLKKRQQNFNDAYDLVESLS